MSEVTVRYRPHSDAFVGRRIGTELVLVPVCGEVAQLENVFVLNEVGSALWQLIERGVDTVSALVSAVQAEFEVDESTAVADVRGFLGQLLERNLVTAES